MAQHDMQPRPQTSDGRRLTDNDSALAAEQARRAAQMRIMTNGAAMRASARVGRRVFAADVEL